MLQPNESIDINAPQLAVQIMNITENKGELADYSFTTRVDVPRINSFSVTPTMKMNATDAFVCKEIEFGKYRKSLERKFKTQNSANTAQEVRQNSKRNKSRRNF